MRRERRPNSNKIEPLVADLDRVWGDRVPPRREILEMVQEMGPPTA